MTTYVFDHRWQKEHARLLALERLFDGTSERRLVERGLAEGWRCLEVGCGAGGIALCMADRVGMEGRVVATDLDTRFIDAAGHANLEVLQHDLLIDVLEEAWFDLAHARAVIEHVHDRQRALEKLVFAVRPGGWVVVEDVHFGGPMAAAAAGYFYPRAHAELAERMYRAVEAVFAAAGADASFGPTLPAALKQAGLEQVGGEVYAPVVPGGTDQWVRGTVEQLAEHLVTTKLVTAEDVTSFLKLTSDPMGHYLPPLMVAAWGRRSATSPADG